MNKQQFFYAAISEIERLRKWQEDLYALGVDTLNKPLSEEVIIEAISLILSENEKQQKWIRENVEWWLYENVEKVIWVQGLKIEVKTKEQLYNFLTNQYE